MQLQKIYGYLLIWVVWELQFKSLGGKRANYSQRTSNLIKLFKVGLMKAILLAAGYGKIGRYNKNPKMFDRGRQQNNHKNLIEKLYQQGIREILINTHYLKEKVDDFIEFKIPKFKNYYII